jgi:hypothetical protein
LFLGEYPVVHIVLIFYFCFQFVKQVLKILAGDVLFAGIVLRLLLVHEFYCLVYDCASLLVLAHCDETIGEFIVSFEVAFARLFRENLAAEF